MGNKPSSSKTSSFSTKTRQSKNSSKQQNRVTKTTEEVAQAVATNPSEKKSNTTNQEDNEMVPPAPPVAEDVHMESVDGEVPRPVVLDVFSDVRERYRIDPKEVGHGHYGVVRKCQDSQTNEWLAIKSIRKSKVNRIDILRREVNLLREVKHPNIIELKDIHEDEKFLHLITELCTGGELFDRIIAKTQQDHHNGESCFSEQDAASLIRCILDAISYCHNVKGIVHRDLKPENFLFKDSSDDAEIKIIDFGLSRHDDENFGVMKTKVGTPYYVAPEVLERRYTKACDMWSIGVITYILLCGYPPFYGDSDSEIFRSVRNAIYDYPSPEWDTISSSARNFIDGLLCKDPGQRMSAREALQHSWISRRQYMKKNRVRHISRRSVTYKTQEGMKKLRKAALTFMGNRLTQAELASLGQIFKAIDVDNNGLLTLDELDHALSNDDLPCDVASGIRSLREKLLVEEATASINWKEFLEAAVERNLSLREEKIREVFSIFDRSQTNHLTMADLVAVFGSENQAKEVMGDVDADMDGVISYEEFKKAILGEKLEMDTGC